MPVNVNEFIKGSDSDTDVLKIENTVAREIQNMRLIDKDGKGLVLTNIGGNEHTFNLSYGFVPIGWVEYNGVAYIASFNESSGEGELGCYPAPRSYVSQDCTLTGFDSNNKQYAPFFNFSGNNNPRVTGTLSQSFTTSLLNFKLENQVEIIAREVFDGSVNIYLAGAENPIRVYNSGFDQDGNCIKLNRRYWNDSFPNEVNLLNESPKHLDINFLGVGTAGKLRAGGYIFFFRYANENYDRTSFFTESNNVVILEGEYASEGYRRSGTEGPTPTNKSANFRISKVDPTYSYIEIGYQYNNNGALEYGVLSERWEIDPNQTTYDISITGYENIALVDASELLRKKPNWDGAHTHEQLENRYFAANLFDTTKYDDSAISDLHTFTQLVECAFDDSLQLQHQNSAVTFLDRTDENFFRGIYNQENNCYSHVGYFRGESYAFGMVFILKNGRETEAFPIKGRDDWDLAATTDNVEGIYRFPTIQNSPTVSGDYVKIMGIKFNVGPAVGAISTWMNQNVEGFYFVRAHRNKNLLYQGITSRVWSASEGPDFKDANFYLTKTQPEKQLQNEDAMPCFDGTFPLLTRVDGSWFNSVWTYATYSTGVWQVYMEASLWPPPNPSPNWCNAVGLKEDESAFFSFDHFFSKSMPIKKPFNIPIGKISQTAYGYNPLHIVCEGGIANQVEGPYAYKDNERTYYFRDNIYTFPPGNNEYIDVLNVAPWEPINNNQFVSYFNEGSETDIYTMLYVYHENGLGTRFWEVRNMEVASESYIGIEKAWEEDHNLINIYQTNPDPSVFNIDVLYDVKSTSYFKISSFTKLADVQAVPSLLDRRITYKGDCYLQRGFLRNKINPKYSPSIKDDGADLATIGAWLYSTTFGFGSTYSAITENYTNVECRVDSVLNKHARSTTTIYDFTIKNTKRESELLNVGYNQQLSNNFFLGINLEKPFFPDNKPSGIMYSNRNELGSFLDGYRLIDVAALKEYDYRMGSIKSIKNHNGTLVSIQEFGINRHLVNERALLNQGTSSGDLLLGSGAVLDSKALNLSDFVGSQHQWSIVKTDVCIYGFDFNKRKIWKIRPDFQVEIISDTKKYRAEVYKISEFGSDETDISEALPDNPIKEGGIVGYYDRKYNDIYFTLIKKVKDGEDSQNKQIVFNEWMDSFQGRRTFKSPMALTINEDFFSFNPNIFPSVSLSPSTSADVWLHEIKDILGVDNCTTFYGNVNADISFVEFIINQPSDIAKVFDKLDISSSPNDLYKISYETQNQLTQQFPFIQATNMSFWRDPVYQENLWRVPILRTETTQEPVNNIYNTDSRVRGRWIKVRLEYKTKSSIFIKSVLTSYRPSSY